MGDCHDGTVSLYPRKYTVLANAATLGDIVFAAPRPEIDPQELWFRAQVKWGGNALIRLIVRRREVEGEIAAWLGQLGCICEGNSSFSLIAVSVPPEVDQATVQHYLGAREDAGDIYYEEVFLRE